MKNLIRQVSLVIFVLFVLVLLYMHFTSLGASANTRITEVRQSIKEQQDAYNYYAPVARQGKIAEQQMSLANQKANLLRQELKELEGKE